MAFMLRIIGSAIGNPTPLDGKFVKEYYPSEGPYGHVVGTDDKREAIRFEDTLGAFNFWQQTSESHPLRPDGKPNRPLTAYTIEFIRE